MRVPSPGLKAGVRHTGTQRGAERQEPASTARVANSGDAVGTFRVFLVAGSVGGICLVHAAASAAGVRRRHSFQRGRLAGVGALAHDATAYGGMGAGSLSTGVKAPGGRAETQLIEQVPRSSRIRPGEPADDRSTS